MIEVLIDKCVGCGSCLSACAYDAIKIEDQIANIDPDKCVLCGACVSACPFEAILLRKAKAEAIDKSEFNGVWVFAEQRDSIIAPVVFELLGKGNTVERALEDVNINGGSIPAGSFVVENSNKTKEVLSKAIFPTHNIESTSNLKLSAVKLPRIALIDSPIQSTDAGWTRFVLDSYGVKYSILTPAEFENLDVKTKFDVIILPNTSASILKEGKQKRNNLLIPSDYPTEYTKGMGSKGVENIIKFINDGGIAISWEASTELFEGTLSINQPNSK